MAADAPSSVNIGINGFGRIGRMVLRAALAKPEINVVAVNDPFISPDYMAYQFKYDSTQGTYQGDVSHDGEFLVIDGSRIKVHNQRDPAQIAWGESGIVCVAE